MGCVSRAYYAFGVLYTLAWFPFILPRSFDGGVFFLFS